MVKRFTELIAWQKAHKFVLHIYRVTKRFPPDERFGLANQLRRAAVSISSNIAEGFGRSTSKDKQHFYTIAKTSLSEVESQMFIAKDLGYISNKEFESFLSDKELVHKLLAGLHKSSQNWL